MNKLPEESDYSSQIPQPPEQQSDTNKPPPISKEAAGIFNKIFGIGTHTPKIFVKIARFWSRAVTGKELEEVGSKFVKHYVRDQFKNPRKTNIQQGDKREAKVEQQEGKAEKVEKKQTKVEAHEKPAKIERADEKKARLQQEEKLASHIIRFANNYVIRPGSDPARAINVEISKQLKTFNGSWENLVENRKVLEALCRYETLQTLLEKNVPDKKTLIVAAGVYVRRDQFAFFATHIAQKENVQPFTALAYVIEDYLKSKNLSLEELTKNSEVEKLFLGSERLTKVLEMIKQTEQVPVNEQPEVVQTEAAQAFRSTKSPGDIERFAQELFDKREVFFEEAEKNDNKLVDLIEKKCQEADISPEDLINNQKALLTLCQSGRLAFFLEQRAQPQDIALVIAAKIFENRKYFWTNAMAVNRNDQKAAVQYVWRFVDSSLRKRQIEGRELCINDIVADPRAKKIWEGSETLKEVLRVNREQKPEDKEKAEVKKLAAKHAAAGQGLVTQLNLDRNAARAHQKKAVDKIQLEHHPDHNKEGDPELLHAANEFKALIKNKNLTLYLNEYKKKNKGSQ